MLLDPARAGLDVWLWAEYDSVGRSGPTNAGREFLAERLGGGTTTIDDARRRLIGDGYLFNQRLGRRKTSVHKVLRHPSTTGARYAEVPAWTLAMVRLIPSRHPGTIRPDAWRIYCQAILTKGRNRELWSMTTAKLGAWIGASATTGARRLRELEEAGLFEVIGAGGTEFTIRIALTPERAEWNAAWFAAHGRQVDAEGLHQPPADSGTHSEAPGEPAAAPDDLFFVPQDQPDSGGHAPQIPALLRETTMLRTTVSGARCAVVGCGPQVSERTRPVTTTAPPAPQVSISLKTFPITADMARWLKANKPQLDADVRGHHERFVDHWYGEEKPLGEWQRLWRGWMRMAHPRLPEGWMPSASLWAHAQAVGPDIDLPQELDAFLDDCYARERRMADPARAWLDWVREAQACEEDE
ncbi:hypothetical protein AB0395_22040 [Streptosporangium sp. NPDC051023]|uniref:hypothetical protein n=1 Tax=Streptosporangium sp. NPDC051023 TaxID=3155410 RepID=UPI003450297F